MMRTTTDDDELDELRPEYYCEDFGVMTRRRYTNPSFSIRRQLGAPQIAGFYTITGESLVVMVRWPGGGLVWNTPIALHVQRRGHTSVHRIVDSTRLVQLALALIIIAMLVWNGRQKSGGLHE
ncbi:MAG: hypothetical protein KJZ95_13820 [Caldilinea sp.]|nr:hypothetical protein [Caldilinea sp.]